MYMRNLFIGLVLSIVLFITGAGMFTYEISQIQPHQVDLSSSMKTMTLESMEDLNVYTKTYLEGIGDVKVVVDSFKEDDELDSHQIIITYPKDLILVHDENNIDFQRREKGYTGLKEIVKIFKDKQYKEYIAKNKEIHIRIRYGKDLKDQLQMIDAYY